ncbi:MAG: hypothetical protein PHD70_10060 [Anaerostipes sp.]|nr:hypothetical protein [Anaerostipes sp.]
MKKKVLHFGGGALGRGLVVPYLKEAGYDVAIADIDAALVDALNQEKGYELCVTDDPSKSHKVSIEKAILFEGSNEELREWICEAEVITTSVRKENLHFVADYINRTLESEAKKIILCAENIEGSGEFFKELLEKNTTKNWDNLQIPNTVVDRICASKWPDSLTVLTETFGEFGYDKTVCKTSMKPIRAEENLEKAFIRKRLLVNTFCDASCFLGKAKGKKYLSDAMKDEEIQKELSIYFHAFDQVLSKKYGLTQEEISDWKKLYKKRLSNEGILRDISTVARNLWGKLELQERFMFPLVVLFEMGEDITEALKGLLHMIFACEKENKEVWSKLEEIWCVTETGTKIYHMAVEGAK